MVTLIVAFNCTAAVNLTQTGVNIPNSMNRGITYAISVRIKNVGNSAATAFTINISINGVPTYNGGQTFLKQISVSGLGANVESTFNTTITIPCTYATGTKYILVGVNPSPRAITETDYTDNEMGYSTQLGSVADLFASNYSLTNSTITAGNSTTANFSVGNMGGTAAGSFTVRFYLSSSTTLNTSSATVLGTSSISSVASCVSPSSATVNKTLPIPTSICTGTYYVFIWVDNGLSISEVSDDNNFQYVSLSVTGVSPPTAPTATFGDASTPSSSITTTTPTLTWSGSASNYWIQISKCPYGSANIIYSANCVSGNSYTVPSGNLSAGRLYRWNMYGGNACCVNGQSSVSNTRYFNIPPIVSVNGSTAICPSSSVVLQTDFYSDASYQWKLNGNNISGANAYTYSASSSGTYTVVNTFSCGSTSASNSINITVQSSPIISSQPSANSYVCNGQDVTLAISATGTNISYQWQKFNGSSWSNVGTNSSTYSTMVTGTYHCIVSGQCGSPKTSNNAVISNGGACLSPTALFAASARTITAGQSVNFLDLSSNSPTSWNWDIQRVQSNGITATFTTSSLANPSVTFFSPGCYKIVLTATNGVGSGTVASVSCYITVNANINTNVPEYVSLKKDYPTGKAGDPVILSTGSFDLSIKDLSVSGIKTDISIERRYLSRSSEIGPFGKGWFFEFYTWIDVSNPYEWQLHHGDGHISYHIPYQDGETKSLYQGMFDSLYYTVSGGVYTYTYVEKNGIKWKYRADGKLDRRVDLNGNSVVCNYSGDVLFSITAPGGRYINLFSNAAGRVTTAVASGGKRADYYYNIDGSLLDSVKVGSSTTRFKYDSYGLTEMYDPNGNRVVKNIYNTSSQVIQQLDPFDNVTTFSYNTPSTLQTTVTNPLSKSKIVRHDNNYHLIESIDELNHKRRFTYNQNGLLDTVINELNYQRKFEYDANNNISTAIDEKSYSDSIGYTLFGRPTLIKDKTGNTLSVAYNANGNPTSITLPNTGVIQTYYNAYGQDTLTIDAKGNSIRKEYSYNGDLSKIITSTSITTFSYDDTGRLTSIVNGKGYTTSFEYNYFDQVTKVTDPMGYSVLFSYDLNGNLSSYTDKEGNVTLQQYDAKDRLTKITKPNNHVTSIYYDVLDRPIKVRDANGNAKLFVYDDASRLISVSDSIRGILASYSYDVTGNVTTVTDGKGKQWKTTYDERGLPVTYTNPLNNQKVLAYNANGQITQLTDELQRNSYWSYNSSGLPSVVTDAYGNTVQHFYDLNNNLDSLIDANGNVRKWTHDAANRMKTYDEGFGQHTFSWDSVGNLISHTDINNKITGFTYNPNNENLGETYQGAFLKGFALSKSGWITDATNTNGTTKFTRDTYGRIIQKIGFYNDTLKYKYDSVGNVLELDYGQGKKIAYGYNSLNQSVSVSDWNNNTYSIFRDVNGLIDSLVYPNGSRLKVTRDDANQVATWGNYLSTNPSSLLVADSLIRNAKGDIIANPTVKLLYPAIAEQSNNSNYTTADRITVLGTNTYQTASSGNITGSSSSQFANTYSYENDGNILNGNLRDYMHNGVQQSNAFDVFNARTAIVNKSAFSIDNILAGRPLVLTEMNYGGGYAPRALNIYSPEGMLLGRDSSGTMQYPLSDVAGNVIALVNSSDSVTDKYAFDPFGDYYTHTGTSTQPFSFLGMYGVQRDSSGLYYDWARYYDAHQGRFLSKDPYPANSLNTQGINSYAYGFNSPTSYVDVNGMKPVNIVAPFDFEAEYRKNTTWWQRFANSNAGAITISILQGAVYAGEISATALSFTPYAVLGVEANALMSFFQGDYESAGLNLTVATQMPSIIANPRINSYNNIAKVGPSPNMLQHIFENPQHNLDELIQVFGSKENAFNAVQKAANNALKAGQLHPNGEGILPTGDLGNIIRVGGIDIRLIGGRIKADEVLISSFSRKGL